MKKPEYYLGCPIWNNRRWVGEVFSRETKPAELLSAYGKLFNTVEGNSLFYGLPAAETIDRWQEQLPEGFRFLPKFPQAISHDKQLQNVDAETEHYLSLMQRLQNRLGPLLLQLPPKFDPQKLPRLARYLDSLPKSLFYCVEVRHRAFFGQGPEEADLDSLLREHRVARVHFDSRALFHLPATDASTIRAMERKPRLPHRHHRTAGYAVVRIVARNSVEESINYLEEWAQIVSGWMKQGVRPFVYTHTPDDFYSPYMAAAFHACLRTLQPELAVWPNYPLEGETNDSQLDLLS